MNGKRKHFKGNKLLAAKPTQLRFQFEMRPDNETCPACGAKLMKSGCWRCPNCNYSSCGL